MPPRRSLGRRTPGRNSPVTRRPRVAGRRHTDQSGAPEKGPEGEPAVDTGPGGPGVATPAAALVIGVLVLVIALVLAAWFRGEANQLSGSAAASNSALVDVGTTAQVSGQVRAAVERIYSYDFARLDDNERAAGEVITGPFAADFREQFALVRKLAPEQQAVVVARVLNLGVKMLDGDRAIVVLFIDQQASRGIETSQLSVAGRLTVTAQRVDGNWKIADIEPF
ncbi:MAG: hypothetical protein ACRDRM_03645 [Pseudonocardiaceae bacterium]